MLLLYRIFFILIITISSPYLFFKAIWGGHGIRERLGFVPKRQSSGRLYWFHAASVGELKILWSVIPEIKKLKPDIEIAISTTTATGRKRAGELYGKEAIIFLLPLEINSAILRIIENLKPEKLILVETEIWPLLIITAAECGLEVDLINARMSRRSYGIYRWFRPLLKKAFSKFGHILAQTEMDAKRFLSLGAANPIVVGNIKFDQALAFNDNKKKRLRLSNPNDLIFVAGSIRQGEDRIFADLIARSIEQNLPVFFILAPRHMKDLDELCDYLQDRRINYMLWSQYRGRGILKVKALLVNTIGELTNFYKLSDLAFVGGSLVPIGGHDPAEPAALGKPVLFGPYMENAQQAARLLIESGGGRIVKGEEDILDALYRAVENRSELAEMGRKCKETILSMSGVSRKTARIIAGDDR